MDPAAGRDKKTYFSLVLFMFASQLYFNVLTHSNLLGYYYLIFGTKRLFFLFIKSSSPLKRVQYSAF